MKAITVNVSDSIYQDFAREAKRTGRPAAELIRQAMEKFHAERLERRTSLRNIRPFDAGGTVTPVGQDEDMLGEMLEIR